MTLRRLDVRGFTGNRRALREVLPRPTDEQDRSSEAVASIIAEVRAGGDGALRRLTQQFDGVELDELRVEEAEIQAALARVPLPLQEALDVAHDRILAYHAHEAARPEVETFESGGIEVRHLVRPVARAGCYAPGGRARYPSTVLMCAVPAQVAGVEEIVLCVPPGPDGRVDDASLAAAAVAGVDEVYRIGGAQAIAAMAYGTESIEPVDVVVGPGNRYVAEAKRQVSGVVGVASAFAGPSEVVVIAGPDTPTELAAIDLVVQAEHGPDGLAWLVTWSEAVAEAVDGPGRPHGASVAPTGRPRGHPRSRRSTRCWWTGRSRPWRWPTSWPPSTSRSSSTTPTRLLPLVQSAGAVFLGPDARRPAWATTWPAPTMSFRPTGRPGSPAPSGSTTSGGTSTPSTVTRAARWRSWDPTW